MNQVSTALKALGHPERLRILAILSRGELTVSELTQILGLSQPRVTQYIKTLEAAGILERLKEGSWVFSRLRSGNAAIAAIVATTLAALPDDDMDLQSDRRRLDDVRSVRAEAADAFFAKVANDHDQLGAEYLPRGDIETHMRDLAGDGPYDFMVDLGTGTGRILEIFADRVTRGSGIDSNQDMLAVARHNLAGETRAHLTVRQADLKATPLETGCADLVTLHQVLHFLDEPRDAIAEAARLLRPGGTILIADFETHNRDEFREKFAHRRLGFSDSDIEGWLMASGLALTTHRRVETSTHNPAVKLWLGTRPSDVEQTAHWHTH